MAATAQMMIQMILDYRAQAARVAAGRPTICDDAKTIYRLALRRSRMDLERVSRVSSHIGRDLTQGAF